MVTILDLMLPVQQLIAGPIDIHCDGQPENTPDLVPPPLTIPQSRPSHPPNLSAE